MDAVVNPEDNVGWSRNYNCPSYVKQIPHTAWNLDTRQYGPPPTAATYVYECVRCGSQFQSPLASTGSCNGNRHYMDKHVTSSQRVFIKFQRKTKKKEWEHARYKDILVSGPLTLAELQAPRRYRKNRREQGSLHAAPTPRV